MKLFLILLMNFSGSMALAGEPEFMIIKSSGGGLSPIDWQYNETCEVYSDYVEITKNHGGRDSGLSLKESREIDLIGNMDVLMQKVAAEKVSETPNNMCDGPSTYIALKVNGKVEVLYSTGGCGNPKQERKGPFSRMFKDVVGTYCPKTIGVDF